MPKALFFTLRLLVSFALALCTIASTIAADSPPLVPDPARTPGDVLTTDAKAICVPGYTKTVRDVPESLKNQIYKNYGIADRKPKEYEVDHLVSLELGGSNSLRNLWPQSYETRPLNARVKDRLENKLHALICKGELDIRQAQKEIATDWIGAYAKYIGPVPGGAPATAAPAPPVEVLKATAAVAASCGGKRTCGQMASCAEARHYLTDCGVSKLDRDGDGTPCESLCK